MHDRRPSGGIGLFCPLFGSDRPVIAILQAADCILSAPILRSLIGEALPTDEDARASARLAFDGFTEHEVAGFLAFVSTCGRPRHFG